MRQIHKALLMPWSGGGGGPNAAAVANGTQVLRVFDAAALQFGAEDFSVLAWVNPTAATPAGQNHSILSKDVSTTGWRLFSNGPSGKYAFAIRGFSPFVTTGAAVIAGGAWAMVAGGHRQAAAQIWASVNGAAPTSTARATAPAAGTSELAIGADSTFSGPGFNGLIERGGIWRRDITADLTGLYNSGVPLRYADLTAGQKVGLEAWWDFYEGSNRNRREVASGLYHAFDAGASVAAVGGIGQSVVLPATIKNLITDGDSLTAGYDGGAYIPWYSYPSQAILDLGPTWQLSNIAVSGYQSAQILLNMSTRIGALYVPSMTKNIYLLEIGVNDLLASVPVATIQSNIQTIVSTVQGFGFAVGILTLTPSQYAGRPGSYDADRITLNNWILAASSGANAICDSGNNAALSNPSDTAVYNADKLHLNKNGYKIVHADAVPTIQGM